MDKMDAVDSPSASLDPSFDIAGQIVVVTGGTGVLGRHLVAAFVRAGANLALIAREPEHARALLSEAMTGVEGAAEALARLLIVRGDVTDRASLEDARDAILGRFSRVDALVNGAGGNRAEATTGPERSFFQLPETALRAVIDLNLLGTLLPTQVFAEPMARQGDGVVLNVTSMNAIRPLTRIPAYSAAKAAVANFTQWLAVHLAQEYSPRLRVNAIAPGFFLTEQNRFLLLDPASGALSARGQAIVAHTPMGRFGTPGDLIGTALWLLSPASAFITGVSIPIDGGFAAFGGV